MRTAQQIEGDYADALGRCETCGVYIDEAQLTETPDGLECPDCLDIDE